MGNDLQSKLRRLGVVKGTRNLKPADKRPAASPRAAETRPSWDTPADNGRFPSLTTLLPGAALASTPVGDCLVLDHVYALTHQHGDDALADLLAHAPSPLIPFLQLEAFADADFRDFLFLDTETTGLAGAGTVAFMVGVAYFEQRGAADDWVLVVRQYFMRDFDDEAALLHLLAELVASKAALVTFNGRSFDVPLLDARYLMQRQPPPFDDMPHLDLLPPARRLWRQRLGSCALGALETSLLGVQRTHEDVPGWMIPGLYHDYLRTGDARPLLGVFYHNQIDMLSMVTLATRVMRLLAQPAPTDPALDLYSLGKWQADVGLVDPAVKNLRLAAQGDLSLAAFHQTLHQLGLLLKRNGRYDEAVIVWQQAAAISFDDVSAHVELAKHFEWREKAHDRALHWTKAALALVDGWRSQAQARLVRAELTHRQQRLQRKTHGDAP